MNAIAASMDQGHPLSDVGTAVLWRALPALLAEGPKPVVEMFQHPVIVSGDPVTRRRILRTADLALRRAAIAVQWGIQQPQTIFTGGIRTVRTILLESWSELRDASTDAMRDGATAAGDVLMLLAARVAATMIILATGARSAFEKFWGIPPIVPVALAFLFGLVLLAGGVWALSTPGGAAAFTAIMKKGGKYALTLL